MPQESPRDDPRIGSSAGSDTRHRCPVSVVLTGLVVALAAALCYCLAPGAPWQPARVEKPGRLVSFDEDPCKQPHTGGSDAEWVKACLHKEAISRHMRGVADIFAKVASVIDEVQDWEVVFGGEVNVRQNKDLTSTVLAHLQKCDIVAGRREGDWVKLVGAPGYVSISVEGLILIREAKVTYMQISEGTCERIGMSPIVKFSACEAAARALHLPDTTASSAVPQGRPYGCYYADMAGLFVSRDDRESSEEASTARSQICSSVETCFPHTTSTTTTSSSSTRKKSQWPSLFCWAVVRPEGYEPELLVKQYERGASIFNCDSYAVLSSGDDFDAGPLEVLAIPNSGVDVDMGDLAAEGVTTNSWLNTWIFMQAWHVVYDKTDALEMDWIAKADPDSVFFPERLRRRVASYTPNEGEGGDDTGKSIYFMNCNADFGDGGDAKLFGSLEVFSRKAVMAYHEGSERCQRDLDWKGWGEDYFMSHCLDHLGIDRVEDFDMLSDRRCRWSDCTDPQKVSFHDFKDEQSYFECWEQSLGEQGVQEYQDKVAARSSIDG